ncbi:PREDICTED: putative nuclease HARBI1 [Vollenhovia emeryi]|uniref:putative nuclease HARBI1 n=1 Tax=Vollenhovia emeryi TaxID=411798 RepID=UPI0005F364B8|nr:PREDICTED: putative nuclease HARBI1 [Vollenhovia emeryi]
MGTFNDGLLLADSAYPNVPYIMTPLQNPVTPQEHLYNEAQIRTRSIIERFFGIWKKKFAVLSIGTRFHTIERTLPIIIATAVLHNIMQQEIEQNVIECRLYDNATVQMEDENMNNRNIDNVRHHIIEYFER